MLVEWNCDRCNSWRETGADTFSSHEYSDWLGHGLTSYKHHRNVYKVAWRDITFPLLRKFVLYHDCVYPGMLVNRYSVSEKHTASIFREAGMMVHTLKLTIWCHILEQKHDACSSLLVPTSVLWCGAGHSSDKDGHHTMTEGWRAEGPLVFCWMNGRRRYETSSNIADVTLHMLACSKSPVIWLSINRPPH